MKQIVIVLIALMASLPFNDWLDMPDQEKAEFIGKQHADFHANNPTCKVSACRGIPRKEVRRFRKDRSVIDFFVECLSDSKPSQRWRGEI